MTSNQEESVRFVNQRGQKLAGLITGPVAESMVICCHGMLSAKDGTKHIFLASELQKLGLSTLRFDFAGRGESEGALWDMSISNEMEDLESAIEFLCAKGVKKIGVFGSSLGGSIALLVAARDERICALATLAAVGHPDDMSRTDPKEIEKAWHDGYFSTDAGKISMRFVEDARNHDVLAATGIILAPLLVLHGDQDSVVPVSDAHDLAAAARFAQLEICFGADHRFSNPQHLRPAMKQAALFLASHLREAAQK